MSKGQEFLSYAKGNMDAILTNEWEGISKAAEVLKETLKNGGLLYTFGTGHSTMLCQEPFFRAGGISACYPIIYEKFTHAKGVTEKDRLREREEGLTQEIFKDYPLKKGDTMMIFCYGGKNATSVDAGLECKRLGINSICITSLEHANKVPAGHSSGKKVHEVCDIVIDTHGPLGDASIDFGEDKVGPISTISGAAIVQAIICECVEIARKENLDPEVLVSMNVPGGDEKNEKYIAKYRDLIKF